MSIHSCSLGAPILLEEAKCGQRAAASQGRRSPTPACDKMKAMGQWNAAWDPFFALDPAWTDEFMATGIGVYASGVLSAKEVELLSIAFDASYTHMYAPGTRRHITTHWRPARRSKKSWKCCKLCVAQGVQACNLGVPILADELRAPLTNGVHDEAQHEADLKARGARGVQALTGSCAAYLFVALGSFMLYRRLVLAEAGVPYLNYGVAAIEAMIIAQVILIGRAFKVGTRFEGGRSRSRSPTSRSCSGWSCSRSASSNAS